MKKLTAVLLTAALLAGALSVSAAAAEKETKVEMNGSLLEVSALADGLTVYLPFRAVCEALGYSVTWTNTGGIVTVNAAKDGDSVSIDVTRGKINDNGHCYNAAVYSGKGVLLRSGRTYVDSGLFGTIFPVSASYDSKNALIALQVRSDNAISFTNESVVSNEKYLKTTVQYPQISGLADTGIQNAVNTVLKQAAENAISEGAQNAADMAQAIQEGQTGYVGMCETYFDYLIEYNQYGLLSIVLSDYQFRGGAHGLTVQNAFTFDLATGKILRLSDLMNPASGYTVFIDSAIRQEIDRRVSSGDLSELDTSPFKDIGADPEFYLAYSGLVVYFQEYEHFPYAAGIQEFSIKYTDLAPMLYGAFGFLSGAPVPLDPKTANTLSVGAIGQVVLNGNPTTGYTWHWSVSDSSVLSLVSSSYSSLGAPGLVGAGGTYVWNFKALKTGAATVTFKYYRDWEGESSATAEGTVVYNIAVS